jgi:hypothetical protein
VCLPIAQGGGLRFGDAEAFGAPDRVYPNGKGTDTVRIDAESGTSTFHTMEHGADMPPPGYHVLKQMVHGLDCMTRHRIFAAPTELSVSNGPGRPGLDRP